MGTRNGRKLLVMGLLFVSLASLLLWGIASQRQHVELRDGLRLEWMGLTEGTNALTDGSLIERVFGDRIPAKGVDVGALKLRRPRSLRAYEEDASLNAWIRLKGPGVQSNKFRFYWEGSRVITANASGREIEIPPPRPKPHGGQVTNEMIVRVPLYAFPRDERTVRLRISPPRGQNKEHHWAEFEFENPSQVTPANWTPASLPITNAVGKHKFVLRKARAKPTEIIFLLPSRNWYVGGCYVTDEEGNRSAQAGKRTKQTGSDEQIVEFEYGLEPNRTWKVTATFVGAPASALMGFSDVNEAEFPPEQRFLVTLIAGGGYAWLTNAIGTTYRCRFDGQTVSIGKPGNRDLPYFAVLGATNEIGHGVGREPGAIAGGLSWRHDGSETVQVWNARQSCTNLVLHLALPTVATTEFYLRLDGGRPRGKE